MPRRCHWVPADDPVYVRYHDAEWGVPLRDSGALFELICLEGAQAGLSWRSILHRRGAYRDAFLGFDPRLLAPLGDAEVERLSSNPSIIRNRAKIRSVVTNARAFLDMEGAGLSFAEHIWSFVGGEPVINRWRTAADVPAVSPASTAMARDLKGRGFAFVGPTICYAFMQAAGLVMDHETECFRHPELGGA